jgi:UDP-glucose 4-epimerase
MKILFTGISSFTGYWFAKELINQGHAVFATLTKPDLSSYEGIRKQRLERILPFVSPVWETRFGDESFQKLIAENNFDIFCHHAAEVTNYKSDTFNVPEALARNVNNISPVLDLLKETGCNTILLTGSLFEGQSGMDDIPEIAFSPYGLSKQLTSDIFVYYCKRKSLQLGKFVIPNPFGPYEDPRFTDYLVKTWVRGEVPGIKTPMYVRDNIHVSLLSKAYSRFITELGTEKKAFSVLYPSGYTESMELFANRFAAEMEKRLPLRCSIEFQDQTDFSEPMKRVNSDPALSYVEGWNEQEAWDDLAAYYREKYLP